MNVSATRYGFETVVIMMKGSSTFVELRYGILTVSKVKHIHSILICLNIANHFS